MTPNNYKRILVPLDFSETSKDALPLAERLLNDPNAELHLVHVTQPVMVYAHTGGTLPPATSPPQEVPPRDELESNLKSVPTSTGVSRDQIKREVIEGAPASSIVEYADDHDIDLIVMTTHGNTGLTRLLMGSVAEYVVRKANCPVLTLKSMGQGDAGR